MNARFGTGRLVLAVLALFTVSYFVAYGPIAKRAHSWKYIIYHHDEYSYWMYTKGAGESPRSDGNPFYFEERGKKQTFPYPTCVLLGLISGWLKFHVFFFHPVWHIGMPFVLWLTLFIALEKIWGYPRGPSAAFALFFLVITLYLRGLGPHILVRYSRPGDALWMLFIWISLVMQPASDSRLRSMWAGLLGALTLWLNPIMFVMGGLVTGGETLYRWIFLKDKRDIPFFQIIYIFFVFGALSYGLYAMMHIADAPWAFHVSKVRNLANDVLLDWFPWVLYTVIAGGIGAAALALKTGLSRMDRLALYVFFMEPLAVGFQVLASANFQFADHRYYFLVIELLCLAGWLTEKIPMLLKQDWWIKAEKGIVVVLSVLTLLILSNKYASFFRYGLAEKQAGLIIDNSLLIATLMPVFILAVWVYFRFLKIRRLFQNGLFLTFFLAGITLTGFAAFGSTYFDKSGYDFPYAGAYRWLNEHAQKDEVALTVSPSRLGIDYLPLFTGLKTYINPIADILAADNKDANYYRFYFYTSLLYKDEPFLGWSPEEMKLPVKDRIKWLRLNYILINLDSPFMENVGRKLDGYLEEVYRDDKSLIWKVKQAD